MSYFDVHRLTFELLKVRVKVRLAMLQEVIWLLLHASNKQLKPAVDGFDSFNV